MNEIKSLVISLIFTAIAISVCELLVPKESYKNQMRLITGTILIISLISPFVSKINFDDYKIDFNIEDVVITNETERAVATSLSNDIQSFLYENNVEQGKIIIETDYDDNSSIIIDQVVILFDENDKSKSEFILEKLKQKYDFEIKVGVL